MKIRFELGSIILAKQHGDRYKSVMLCGAQFWSIQRLQYVLKLYEEEGIV